MTSARDGLFHFEGSRELLLSDAGAITRAEAAGRTAGFAARVSAAGMAPGDRVAILTRDPAQSVLALYGILCTDCVGVPIHPRAPEAEIRALLAESGARGVVASEDEFAPFGDLAGVVRIAPPEADDDIGQGPSSVRSITDTSAALLLYTSGTTGRPKAVTVTPASLGNSLDLLTLDLFCVDDSDTLLLSAPMANVYGMTLALAALIAGARLSLVPGFQPTEIPQTMARDGVTFVAGVPMLAQIFLRVAERSRAPFTSLKRLMLGGSRLPESLTRALTEKLGVVVTSGFGATEAVPITIVPDVAKAPPGTVGRVSRKVEIRVVNEGFADVPTGTPGEILVRGPNVMPGYFNAPDANALAFHDGWYRTGDIGYLDSDGYLFLVDRLKNILKVAGNTVYPAEIEATLAEHPAVSEVAVIGRDHETVGQIPVAYVTRRPGMAVDAAELRSWCEARLTPFKHPRAFEFLEQMPMTPTGKIARQRLADRGQG